MPSVAGAIAQAAIADKAVGPLRVWPGGLMMSRSIGNHQTTACMLDDPWIVMVAVCQLCCWLCNWLAPCRANAELSAAQGMRCRSAFYRPVVASSDAEAGLHRLDTSQTHGVRWYILQATPRLARWFSASPRCVRCRCRPPAAAWSSPATGCGTRCSPRRRCIRCAAAV